jgi:DHA2 family multidrug resistance protein-like MFS transporter
VLWLLAGLAAGLVFVRRQASLAEPLVDLRLFRAPAFTVSLAANTIGLFLVFGTFFLTAQYLQLVLGLPPLTAGLWAMPPAAGFIAGSQLAPVIVRRLGPGATMSSALVIAAAGLAILARLPGSGGGGLAALVTGSVLLALGVSPVITLATDLIVGAVPAERAGVASGLSETGTELGGALGIALLGSITTAVYRSQLTGALPAGLRPHTVTAARGTLAAAVHAADRLPPHLGEPLLAAARSAFTEGLHLAVIVAGVLAITLAVSTAAVLRRPQPTPDTEPAPHPTAGDELRTAQPAQARPR